MKTNKQTKLFAKRMLSLLLTALLVVSMFVVAIVPASAITATSICMNGGKWGSWDSGNTGYNFTQGSDGVWTFEAGTASYVSGQYFRLFFNASSDNSLSSTNHRGYPLNGDTEIKEGESESIDYFTRKDGHEGTFKFPSLSGSSMVTIHVSASPQKIWYTIDGGTDPTDPTTSPITDPTTTTTAPVSGNYGEFWLTGFLNGENVTASNGATSTSSRYFTKNESTGLYSLTYTFSSNDEQYITLYNKLENASSQYYVADYSSDTQDNPANMKSVGTSSYNASSSIKVKIATPQGQRRVTFIYNPSTKELSYSSKSEYYTVKATLFDYYYDDQVNNNSAINQGLQTGTFATPFGYFNSAVSSYFQAARDDTGNGLPSEQTVYIGNEEATSTGFTPLYFGDLYNHTPTYYHYHRLANVAATNNNKANALGLVDLYLNENGNPTQNGLEMPYFSTDWFDNTTTSGKKLGSYYEGLGFPLKITEENGVKKYSYDSSSDGNRYYKEGESDLQIGENVIQRTSESSNAGAGYFPFNATNPGNQSNLNYGNGTVLEIPFFMTEDGKINGQAINFTFSGDDDVWVFIDGVLVLDLGGAHARSEGSINFETAVATVKNGYRSYYSNTSNTPSSTTASVSKRELSFAELIPDLYDISKQHTLTMFHMERGMFESNLSLSFTLPQYNTFEVVNNINANNVNPGLKPETYKVADEDGFGYTLKSNSEESETIDNDALYPNDDAFTRDIGDDYNNVNASLKTGITDSKKTVLEVASSATRTPYQFAGSNGTDFIDVTNTSYIWGDNYLKIGESVSQGAGLLSNTIEGGRDQLYLMYGQNARFYNQFNLYSAMQLTQQNNIYRVNRGSNAVGFTDNSNRIASKYYDTAWKLKDGNSLLTEASGTTVENPANSGKFTLGNALLRASKNANVVAEYTNTVKTTNILISKELDEDSGGAGVLFSFKVEFDGIFGSTPSGTYKVYSGTQYKVSGNESTIAMDETGIIQIMPGQTATISGIPVGTKYKITEIEKERYSVSEISAPDTTNTNLLEATAEGKVSIDSADDITITYYNTDKEFEVTYFYHPRIVENGKPTIMGTEYKAVKKLIPRLDRQTIIDYAPLIVNILDTYWLPSEVGEETDDAKIVIDEQAGKAQAIFGNTPIKYNLTYNIGPDSVSISAVYNTLITAEDGVEAPAELNGSKFLYWASLQYTDPVTKAQVWEPVSTQRKYMYRIIQNLTIRAVYASDLNPTLNNQPFDVDYEYGVNTSDVIYDAYTTQHDADVPNQNRIRANVPINPVGVPDTDMEITDIGYVRVNSYKEYATGADVTQEQLIDFIEKGTPIYVNKNGANMAANKVQYSVPEAGHLSADSTSYPDISANQATLTNKNRANFVIDFPVQDNLLNRYYTIYTYMYKDGKLYVSPSPAFVSLKDAPKQSDPEEPEQDIYYSVSASSNVTTLGTVTTNKAYAKDGETVRFTATAKQPFLDENENMVYPEFKEWIINGDTYDESIVDVIVLGANITAVANFEKAQGDRYAVTVGETTGGAAFITKVNDIAVTPTQVYYANEGDVVTITAEPESGYSITGWSNGATGASTTVTVGTEPITITPTFAAEPIRIQVAVTSTEAGSATVNNKSFDDVEPNSSVNLSATAKTGYKFKHWLNSANEIVSTSAQDSVTVTKAEIFTAVFEDHMVTLTPGTSTGGTVKINDSTTAVTVRVGSSVKLEAVPNSNYTFTRWNHDNSTTNPHALFAAPSTNTTYTATFTESAGTFTVNAVANKDGIATVKVNGDIGTNDVTSGTKATLTVEDFNEDIYSFKGWYITGSSTTDDPLSSAISFETPTITAEISYTAVFERKITIKNDIGWSAVSIYTWKGDSKPAGSWPGTVITKDSVTGYYTYTIAIDSVENFIINNNNNGQETGHIAIDYTTELYIINSDKSVTKTQLPRTIYLGVISYMSGTFNPPFIYYNVDNTTVAATDMNKTAEFDVGYWDSAQTFKIYSVQVPKYATEIKFRDAANGNWYAGNITLSSSNNKCYLIFNYSGDKNAIVDYTP